MFAKSFPKSLQKLGHGLQTAAHAAIGQFLMTPEAPGLNFEPVQGAREKDFFSIRVNDDVRIILYKKDARVLFLYTDHHDKAYKWAERHKISENLRTGAAQLIDTDVEEIRKKVTIQAYEYEVREPPVFASWSDGYLLDLGVPPQLLSVVNEVSRSGLYDLIGHMPEDVMERLMRLADGDTVVPPSKPELEDPFEHPDAKRQFREIENLDELKRALEYPWEEWLVFLHPAQEEVVERDFNGPARVTGAAGTGKTVVALHRVARLYHHDEGARIFFTTFSKALAARLEPKLELLLGDASRWNDRVAVANLHKVARQIYVENSAQDFQRINDEHLNTILDRAANEVGDAEFASKFLRAEWDGIVDALGITAWEEYRSVPRVGRGTAMGASQRRQAWRVFERVYEELEATGRLTFNMLCHQVADMLDAADARPFDHVIVDEAQDFGPAELRLCRALAPRRTNDLFLAGDPGQRIYKGKFSWLSQGIDVRGRSACLRVNYRTTEQIRAFADRILPESLSFEGDDDRSSYSVFAGVKPEIYVERDEAAEVDRVVSIVDTLLGKGYKPGEIGIFARTRRLASRLGTRALERLGLEPELLHNDDPPTHDRVELGTMHSAKGLEFRAVILVACDSGVVPNEYVLEQATDAAELDEAVEKEKHLLYVAATRAREELFITSSGAPSSFLKSSIES